MIESVWPISELGRTPTHRNAETSMPSGEVLRTMDRFVIVDHDRPRGDRQQAEPLEQLMRLETDTLRQRCPRGLQQEYAVEQHDDAGGLK